ncbi:hypothetical protein F0Q45_00065 [Mycobacterium simiae]|uniref:Uncharacterized protein n=1 Tax=Mycobacterium simiae TaxID=1784 RepID=A0A5B1BXI1_MYCSI|nr:hypothetical protein [Mycobacterium simiae]KAA1252130.1 hypothetical protein F0Q45_00065 [Mycobacterium simiae]
MIFLGRQFWTEQLPVLPVLQALFVGRGKLRREDFDQLVRIVDSPDEAVEALLEQRPAPAKMMDRIPAVGYGPLMQATRPMFASDPRSSVQQVQ